MVKVVAMFNLPEGTDEAEFEKYFVNQHARKDAAKIPGLRRYVIGKVVGSPAGQPAWYRVNELWFDSVKAATKAFSSKIAVDCTNDLMPRDQSMFWMGKFPIDDMQVGPANGASIHLQHQLVTIRLRQRQVSQSERAPLLFKQHGSHDKPHGESDPIR